MLPIFTLTALMMLALGLPTGLANSFIEDLPDEGWKNKMRAWGLAFLVFLVGVALAVFVAIPLNDLLYTTFWGSAYEPFWDKIFSPEPEWELVGVGRTYEGCAGVLCTDFEE